MVKSKKLIKAEEIFNSVSHAVGVVIAIACLVLLVIFSALKGNPWLIVSVSIFGSSMIALYIASTIFHSSKNLRKKSKRNIWDHSMIYVLIAGTYTPISLVCLRETYGWIIFGIIWAMAITGVIYKLFFYSGTKQERKISAWLYVIMGYTVIGAIVPLIHQVPSTTLWFLLAGCLSYSSGVAFYLIKKIPFGHGVFHLTIIGGSVCHFFAFLFLSL